MSVAKKLRGGGGSFGALAQGESWRDDVAARSEALDATGRVRRSSLAPVGSIVFNPLNPRKTIVDETIAELGESLRRHQIVPVTVVSRDAFVDAHPDQAGAVGGADFVALDGNRRLLAAQRVGLTHLRVDLNDDLVATASEMVEAALVANAHREGVPPFEEAQAIEQLLLTVYGGNQAAVARKLGKSAAWVGQRLALLHLAPELQEQANAGDLAIEDARKIGAEARAGKLQAAEQLARAEEAKQAAADKLAAKAAAKAQRVAVAPAADDGASDSAVPSAAAAVGDVNGVYSPTPEPVVTQGDHQADDVNGVYAAAVPEQREAAAGSGASGIVVTISPTDLDETARAICQVLDHHQAAELASALAELARREAGLHTG